MAKEHIYLSDQFRETLRMFPDLEIENLRPDQIPVIDFPRIPVRSAAARVTSLAELVAYMRQIKDAYNMICTRTSMLFRYLDSVDQNTLKRILTVGTDRDRGSAEMPPRIADAFYPEQITRVFDQRRFEVNNQMIDNGDTRGLIIYSNARLVKTPDAWEEATYYYFAGRFFDDPTKNIVAVLRFV